MWVTQHSQHKYGNPAHKRSKTEEACCVSCIGVLGNKSFVYCICGMKSACLEKLVFHAEINLLHAYCAS
jgi:hypothetical protein